MAVRPSCQQSYLLSSYSVLLIAFPCSYYHYSPSDLAILRQLYLDYTFSSDSPSIYLVIAVGRIDYCCGSVKNGFYSAILTKIPRMKKEEGLGRRQTTKCGAKRQARTLSRDHATTIIGLYSFSGSRYVPVKSPSRYGKRISRSSLANTSRPSNSKGNSLRMPLNRLLSM